MCQRALDEVACIPPYSHAQHSRARIQSATVPRSPATADRQASDAITLRRLARRLETRNALYRGPIDALVRRFPSIKVFDPSKYLCDDALCWDIRDGTMLYRDHNHLSVEGSQFMAGEFGLEYGR